MKNQTTVPQPAMPDAGSSLIQVSGALTLIILFILLFAWMAKRFGFTAKTAGMRGLKLNSSLSLGAREKIVIVEVEDARLVLGVTATSITPLHTLPPAPPAPEQETAPAGEFQNLMKNLLKRSGRK
ncbi:flagellar type III secretion system protein FliO [Cronobacter dublinensis subsp. dublinensis]|nr:flagellar type III secretion system protein FliO [Cronobacter dublinensis subsp. dublinensis]EGT5737623.1 flagellar type III secretion system protein FliO [Cronobacter dublinensis subsp. dublinensis]